MNDSLLLTTGSTIPQINVDIPDPKIIREEAYPLFALTSSSLQPSEKNV